MPKKLIHFGGVTRKIMWNLLFVLNTPSFTEHVFPIICSLHPKEWEFARPARGQHLFAGQPFDARMGSWKPQMCEPWLERRWFFTRVSIEIPNPNPVWFRFSGHHFGSSTRTPELQAVCDAIRAKQTRFMLQGDEINLNPQARTRCLDSTSVPFWNDLTSPIAVSISMLFGIHWTQHCSYLFKLFSKKTTCGLQLLIIFSKQQLTTTHTLPFSLRLAASSPWTRAIWVEVSCPKDWRPFSDPSPWWYRISSSSWRTCSWASWILFFVRCFSIISLFSLFMHHFFERCVFFYIHYISCLCFLEYVLGCFWCQACRFLFGTKFKDDCHQPV